MMKFEKASRYDIRIRHTINGGMIVKIGCAEFSFNDPRMMIEAMQEYYKDPNGMEKVYNDSTKGELQEVEIADQQDRRSLTSSRPPNRENISEEACDSAG